MIKKRLLMLADRLDRIADRPLKSRQFDLLSWRHKDHCGTHCCAVGEATYMPAFKALGLKYNARIAEPEYRGESGWGAVQKFFGIGREDALNLFSSESYQRVRDPKIVADRIRELVGRVA
jgi:hypothetical protein